MTQINEIESNSNTIFTLTNDSTKLEIELKTARTQEEIHKLLKICDSLYKGEQVKGYTCNDLPSDNIYEEYVKISNYPSTIIIQTFDNRPHITTSPMVMYINQVLNSFIFNRYEFNKNKVEAIIYFLTNKKFKDAKEIDNNSGNIKQQFINLLNSCKNKNEEECFDYFMELGVNYDIIDDLVKMVQFVKNYVSNNSDNIQSKYTYINNPKKTKILDNIMI